MDMDLQGYHNKNVLPDKILVLFFLKTLNRMSVYRFLIKIMSFARSIYHRLSPKSAELNICRNQLAVVMVIINHISLSFAFTRIKEE